MLNAEKISDAVGALDEAIVAPAAEERLCRIRKTRRGGAARRFWIPAASAAVCLGIVGGVFAMNGGNGISVSASAETLAEAAYPEAARYPNEQEYINPFGYFDDEAFDRVYEPWQEQKKARREAAGALGDMAGFYRSTVRTFLSDSGEENRVYSPVSLYSALAMLAETTDGESREQILDLLNAENIEALRVQAKNLWAANYRNDGATTSILANSVWLDQEIDFVRETVDRLADDYYASSYRGTPGSEEFDALLRDWLNEQTGGLLEDAVQNTRLLPNTLLALYSTVYFRAKWEQQFQPANNDRKIFHAPGGDRETEFMNATNSSGVYFWGEDFGAYRLSFADGGEMWLILPDEDKTTDEVLASGEYLEMIAEASLGGAWENSKQLIVHYSVPKFDVSSELSLREGLESLGVTDIFDAKRADFRPLTGNSEGAFVGSARHAARVVIDEEGCTAAAFTEMAVCGAGMPPEDEMDFILDRPFLFVITGDTGEILFAGTVKNP